MTASTPAESTAGDAFVAIDHPADRLLARIEARRAPVCVGLDPVLERLPDAVRGTADGRDPAAAADAIEVFGCSVLDAVAGHVPAVKPQSACYERYGWAGVRALERTMARARELGLEVILDVKRGDIGISAAHYAAAAKAAGADWVTVNPYLGLDGLQPALDAGLGAFALVRTSNRDGDAVQALPLAGASEGDTVADAVADLVKGAGASHFGERGWSRLGAVVGATRPGDAARLRARMPGQWFLVPGFGAQGGGVDDVKPCFDAHGHGAVITASRSVIYAGAPGDPKWMDAVADAAGDLADSIGTAAGLR